MSRKETDRRHSRKVYEQYKRKRQVLLDEFGNKCWLCDKADCRLEFHHLVYGLHGKYGHASMWRRIQHLNEIESQPENFRLLCRSCHTVVTHLEHLPRLAYQKLMSIIQVRA